MSTARVAIVALAIVLVGCEVREEGEPRDRAEAAVVPLADTGRRLPATTLSAFRSIGRTATAEEIRAWNIDANATGVGLPRGKGTYDRGAVVFAQQCAACHGPKGEGIPPNPRLVGAEPRDFSFAQDPRIPKTIGNYWPYATTLYDYINRAMPFTSPGSLPPDDVYSVVAFLLAENGIIDRRQVMDAESLPRVYMPAKNRFVPDDRAGGSPATIERW